MVLGTQAEKFPQIIEEQVRDGHELANHSWSHADLSALSFAQIQGELQRTDELLESLTGRTPTVIRPPFGRINGALLQHAALAGQRILLWDLRLLERS